MNHLAVLPVVVPLATAAVLVLLAKAPLHVRRIVSGVSLAATFAVALALLVTVSNDGYVVYRVGGWPGVMGIVLAVDRFAAAMVVLADVVTLAAFVHALGGGDARSRHFHTFLALQLAGVHGAFLTGDFFNLFVFFEVLLIASYCLLLHGKGKRRMRAAVKYVTLNLIASAVFLVALGVLYGSTGALNMAAVADVLEDLDPLGKRLVSVAAALFGVVFALKAALVPVHFWLAGVYASARSEVAASFAILTKVGVYCLVRLVVILPGATHEIVTWLLPAALATQLIASFGALGTRDPARAQGYLLVSSVGVMSTGVALVERAALAAALFYLAHSTLTVAAMFLVVTGRGLRRDRVAAASYVIGSLAAVGLPPLSGFIGKAALLGAAPAGALGALVIATVLASSLMALAACARIGIDLFWQPHSAANKKLVARRERPGALVPLVLLAALAALTIFARPAFAYAERASDQLRDRVGYVSAVLGSK